MEKNFVGQKVLIRTYAAGVHVGELVGNEKNECILRDSRRINYFKCKKGTSLSSISQYGLDERESLVTNTVPYIHLIGVVEIIPLSKEAIDSIAKIKPKGQ